MAEAGSDVMWHGIIAVRCAQLGFPECRSIRRVLPGAVSAEVSFSPKQTDLVNTLSSTK